MGLSEKLYVFIFILFFQPDESTGSDYERIDRKYDSEEEFEIIWGFNLESNKIYNFLNIAPPPYTHHCTASPLNWIMIKRSGLKYFSVTSVILKTATPFNPVSYTHLTLPTIYSV